MGDTHAELEATVAAALRERDHWKRAAEQRGQTMNETLAHNTFLLEKAMAADRRIKAVERELDRLDFAAEQSRSLTEARLSHQNMQLALMAAEVREKDVQRIRAALGEATA